MRFAFAVMAIGLATLATAHAKSPDWQQYRPAAPGFGIEMPGQPTLKTDEANGRRAYSATVTIDRAGAGTDLVFRVKYQATKRRPGPEAEGILDEVVKSAAAGGKLLSDRKETLGGYPARRFATEDADKDTYQIRCVLTDRYFIEIIFLGPLDNALGKRFLDSFTIPKA